MSPSYFPSSLPPTRTGLDGMLGHMAGQEQGLNEEGVAEGQIQSGRRVSSDQQILHFLHDDRALRRCRGRREGGEG